MKILLSLIFLFASFTPMQEGTIVANKCPVYSSSNFEEILTVDEEQVYLKFGDKVCFIEEADDFIKISFDYKENQYQGYVYKLYVCFNKKEQELYPVFNATVARETDIYDINGEPSPFKAKAGQKIFIYSGYSSQEGFTAISLVVDDPNVEGGTILYYGLIKTSDISTTGINGGLITGIVVILSCLTIIFLLLFMKKKKRQ